MAQQSRGRGGRGRGRGGNAAPQAPEQKIWNPPNRVFEVDWDSQIVPSRRLTDALSKDLKSFNVTIKDGEIKVSVILKDDRVMSIPDYRAFRRQKVDANADQVRRKALLKRLETRIEFKDVQEAKNVLADKDNFQTSESIIKAMNTASKEVCDILLMTEKRYRSFRPNAQQDAPPSGGDHQDEKSKSN